MNVVRNVFRHKDGQEAKLNKAILKRIFHYARPYRRQMLILLGMVLVNTVLGLAKPLIFRDLIDTTLPGQDLSRLNWLAGALFILPIIGGYLSVWQRKLNSSVSEGVIFDLRRDLYSHLQGMSIRFFTNTKTGELMSRLNNDVGDAQKAISSTMLSVVTLTLRFVTLIIVMGFLEWRLLLISLLLLPIYIPLSKRTSDRMDHIARDKAQHNAAMNALMHETLNIGGVLLVKIFGQRRNEINRFTEHAEAVRDVDIEKAAANQRFTVLSSLLGSFGVALIYWVGGYLVLQDVFTIGTIVAFSTYLGQFYGTLQAISELPPSLATSLVSFERVFEVIDLPAEIQDRPNAIALPVIAGNIEFAKVSFHYDSNVATLEHVKRRGQVDAVLSGAKTNVSIPLSQARVDALKDVSFKADAGQLVALVGPSGAGKTTMTYLIPRLYDPSEGQILLDGHDLRDIEMDSLAQHIGMVTQDTYLFHDTIATNLRYAKPDATQAELESACRAAHIHDFISELPAGYETIVGERGYRLSGGEKQRLAIARVILKQPRILVLDEATSHLDSRSEKLIQEAMETITRGRTSFVIAHRLSTIQAADLILVMDRGQIVERGTHDELLAQNGLYAQLYRTQFKQEQQPQEMI